MCRWRGTQQTISAIRFVTTLILSSSLLLSTLRPAYGAANKWGNMDTTTTGRYRVLSVDAAKSVARLVNFDDATRAVDAPHDATEDDTDPFAPIAVSVTPDTIHPGAVIDATIEWEGDTAQLKTVSVVKSDRFYYKRSVTGMFEAAIDAWRTARAAGDAVGSTVTRSTDGEPNGVLYVFANQPGEQTFDAIRTGGIPIEPLILRAEADLSDDVDRGVFILESAEHGFVAVYIVFRNDGILAETVRDTYDIRTDE